MAAVVNGAPRTVGRTVARGRTARRYRAHRENVSRRSAVPSRVGATGLWHVFSEDWQTECCGEPFAVGDEVSRPSWSPRTYRAPTPGSRTPSARPAASPTATPDPARRPRT
ncbi:MULTISPECIES: DUF6578 domain-containing protein [Streptomyces]|uniref:DUF6578 domain-containing protein n=1 Tax=Streptomyces fimbriatus TaxID=68197 RepID=A0ABW0D163_STRFI